MRFRSLKAGVSRMSMRVVTVAAVAVLVGCGDSGERAVELPAGSGEESSAVLYGAEDAAADDADADGADVEDADVDGVVVGGGVGGDPVEVGDGGVVGDAGASGVVAGDEGGIDGGVVVDDGSDAGEAETGGRGRPGFVDPYVGHVGGVLVEGVCGFPGPLCAAGEGVAPLDEGGRLWWRPWSNWELWVGRVLDMCDDHEALAAIAGEYWTGFNRGIDYGVKIRSFEMERIVAERQFHPIVCSDAEAAVPRWMCGGSASELRAYLEGFEEPPASSEVMAWVESQGLSCWDAAAERRRFVYVTVDGPMLPRASVEEAAEAYREEVARYSAMPGTSLGFLNLGPPYSVESPQDALVVLHRSVSVIGGVVRGLAQNHSERLCARNVSITATDPAGVDGVGRFALTVQPGEVAPFEIEGWTGSEDPAEISFEVSADLSPKIDLTRSLKLSWHRWHLADEEEYLGLFPAQMAAGQIPDGAFDFVEVVIERRAPRSHPRLAEAAREQTIEKLAVYAATFDVETATVSDVFELAPLAQARGPLYEWVEVGSIPAELPDGRFAEAVTVGSVPKNYNAPLIWAGEVA